MAKRTCELCGKESKHMEMHFGVQLCPECDSGYSKAKQGEPVAYKIYSDPKNFPNATPKAVNEIIQFIASKPFLQPDTSPSVISAQPIAPQATQYYQSNAPANVTYTPTYTPPAESFDGILDKLYADIGKKIKNWAKWIFITEAIAAIIGALVLLFSGEDDLVLAGIILLILGPLFAGVSSWLLYAFGELVDKTAANERHTQEILNYLKNSK